MYSAGLCQREYSRPHALIGRGDGRLNACRRVDCVFKLVFCCGRMRDEKVKGAKKEVKNSRFLHTITTTIQVVLVTSVRTAPPIHGGGNPYQYIIRCCKQFFCILRLSMCRHLSLLLLCRFISNFFLPELQNCFYKLEVVVTY